MMRRVFAGVTLVGAMAAVVDAAVLCQKKSGAVFVRETACKKKEAPVDVSSLLGTLPERTAALESSVTALQTDVASLDDVREVVSLTGAPTLNVFTYDTYLNELSFTNTTSGRARISLTIAASTNCIGTVIPFGILYLQVDGVDVPDSGAAIHDNGTIYPVRLEGTTTAVIEPGTHTVRIALDCIAGGTGFAYGPHIDGDVTILRIGS
jgi:hypothetical protein